MKQTRYFLVVLLVLALALTLVGAAAAEEAPTCTPVAAEGSVEGTVIGVDDAAGTVDVLLADGSCVTLTLQVGDYDHPIVALLAAYFGGASLEDYQGALDGLVLGDSTVASLEDQGDGTWLATLADGTTVVITDADQAAAISDALDTLAVNLDITTDDDGNLVVPDVGEQIEAYHDDGYGFGVLVKVYAIAAESAAACEAEAQETADTPEEPCGVSVEELIALLDSGMGMGQLFALYGKPSLLGVGHVRQALNAGVTSGDSGDGSGDNKGICNARSHGGKANANGQDVNCP